MTTPMSVYKDLAIQYGNINTDDPDAVNRFFETDVYALPEEIRLRIIRSLFKHLNDDGSEENIPEIPHENIPLPDPANYQRADSKRRTCRSDRALNMKSGILWTSKSKYKHAISDFVARLTKMIWRIENRLFNHRGDN